MKKKNTLIKNKMFYVKPKNRKCEPFFFVFLFNLILAEQKST